MNPNLQERAIILQKKIRQQNPEKLEQELKNQLTNKISELLSVSNSLNQSDYQRKLADAETIWSEGSTNLLHHPADNYEHSIIIIPSLINKSYIIDLSEKRSFIRYLSSCGINAYLVDWGEPANEELHFGVDEYIENRLDKIIKYVHDATNKKVILAGYCMGGLLAIASCLRNSDKVKALALFATPWDFHVDDFARFKLDRQSINIFENILENSDKVPAPIIQAIFYYLHPNSVKKKFDKLFQAQNRDEENLAIEKWVNDGISMTGNVAKECFIGWVHNNNTANNNWRVRGKIIDPSEITVPSFIVNAEGDNIVPKSSSAPLTKLISNNKTIITKSGHISMVAGKNAKSNTWKPFVEWIEASA